LNNAIQGLQNKNAQSAIELLMTQPALLENLRKAHMGNYGVVLSLLGCLEHGLQAKKLVDRIIDASAYQKQHPGEVIEMISNLSSS
jgi:hypothetical protein